MSNKEGTVHKNGFSISNLKRLVLFLGVTFVLAVLGWFVSSWNCGLVDAEMRRKMMRQAVELARTINPEYAKVLSFTAADKGTSVYERIRRQMIAYGRYTGQRNICSMAIRGGAIVFGPENLPEKDPMASPPGTVYENPSAEDFQVFKTGEAKTMGPNTDEYGTFVSALAPVLDPKNGKVLMVIGLDVPADEWSSRVAANRRLPIMFTVLLALVLLGGMIGIQARDQLSTAQQARLRYLESIMIGLLGIILTAALSLLIFQNESRERRMTFEQMADTQVENVKHALSAISLDLTAIARFSKKVNM